MQKALDKLGRVGEFTMGCNCKHKNNFKDQPILKKDMTSITTENYQSAFLNETRKTTRLAAEKQELEMKLDLVTNKMNQMNGNLDMKLQKMEWYATKLMDEFEKDKLEQFIHRYGRPPISLRITNGK